MPQLSVLNRLMREHINMLEGLSPDEASRRLSPKELDEYRERARTVGQKFTALFTGGYTDSFNTDTGTEYHYEAIDTGLGLAHDGPVKVTVLPVQVQSKESSRLVSELRIYDASMNADRLDLVTKDAARFVGGCALDIQATENVVGVRELSQARFLDDALDRTLQIIKSNVLA